MSDDSGKRELVKLTRTDALAIIREGQDAAARGDKATACPYSAAGNATERVRVQAWLQGFLGGPKSS